MTEEIEDKINQLLSLLQEAVYEKDKEKCEDLGRQISIQIKEFEKLEGNNREWKNTRAEYTSEV